ncbi:MAG: AfsR/SARP family transcriptional regulator [Oscillospiraceae bacterium]|jgi:hypothetical protein
MRCIIVGKKEQESRLLEESCVASGVALPVEVVSSWEMAVKRMELGGADLLFLDQTCVPSYDQLCKWKEDFPRANLILTVPSGATPIYQRGDSFGQLHLPASKRQVDALLKRVNQLILFRNLRQRVTIRTFGRFDLYVDHVVVVFPNSRSKELLAMLVDRRGGVVTTEEMMEVFWPEAPPSERHKAICRKAASQLHKTLQLFGVEGILIFGRNQRAIAVTAVECDYYRYLTGDHKATEEYHGEYMVEYSWAEETNGRLYHLAQTRRPEG